MIALEPGAQFSTYMPSAWPHLDAATVTARLHQLRKDPNLIEQGALGLCGEATFYHHLIQLDPVGFFGLGLTLFMKGYCALGKLFIDPDSDLLNADYQALVTARGTTFPPMPPQADWMLLGALRDSQNELLDYEGAPEEDVAEGSDYEERWMWYFKTRLYKQVRLETNTDLTYVKTNVLKTPSNHISMRIKIAMIQSGTGKHVISLETPLVIDEANDSVTFDYWTWGNANFDTANLTVAEFADNYLGAIIAEF